MGHVKSDDQLFPAPDRGYSTSQVGACFRTELVKKPHDVVDEDWAGGVEKQYGVAPRIRIGCDKWFNLLWLIPIGLVLLIIGIAVAKGLREIPAVHDFVTTYPGESKLPGGAPVGFPAWLGWQHFLNAFLMIFIIRSGVTILADHPRLYLTRHSTPGKDWFRMQKPVPSDPLYTAKNDSLALITGLGMSPALSTRFRRISSIFGIQVARSFHFAVLCWFVVFIIVHVTLVFTTGALRNLNHMYASRNDESWIGFSIFAVSLIVMIVAWVAATPLTYRFPRTVQKAGYFLIGPAQRLFEHLDAKPGQYTEKDISPYFWHNGKYPATDEFEKLRADNFASYRLRINGFVENPVDLDLAQLRSLAHHEQITQHFCIQGWSGVAKWGGVSMSTILDLVKPSPKAKWVIFYSYAPGPDGGLYNNDHEFFGYSQSI